MKIISLFKSGMGMAIACAAVAWPIVARPFSPESFGALRQSASAMNPSISVVIDGQLYGASGDGTMADRFERMRGFGAAAGGDREIHGHFEDGFNLRDLELVFSADVDPYFKGWATVAAAEDGADLEEAVAQTTGLPLGLQMKLGKFFSDFSRQNATHAHDWSFADSPLINQLLLGDHGLNEKGAQLSWMAPTPFFLTVGLEALQGENEHSFAYLADGDNPLPERSGPRLFLGWAKIAPVLSGAHAFQVGFFGARGSHQEAAGGFGGEGDAIAWMNGRQWLGGMDFVYRHTPPTAYGHRWLTVEGGYLYRDRDLDGIADPNADGDGWAGGRFMSRQDGAYLQSAYGILPRWRVGLRGDVAGLTNLERLPDGLKETHDPSVRLAAMVDWTLTEFSRLRFQVNRGRYETDAGRENVTEVMLQAVFSIGTHGAHKF